VAAPGNIRGINFSSAIIPVIPEQIKTIFWEKDSGRVITSIDEFHRIVE
jgi:hypothetical protein